jgi:hypothetical protein
VAARSWAFLNGFARKLNDPDPGTSPNRCALVLGSPRHEDHRQMRRRSPELEDELEPIDVVHPDVGKHQIGPGLPPDPKHEDSRHGTSGVVYPVGSVA